MPRGKPSRHGSGPFQPEAPKLGRKPHPPAHPAVGDREYTADEEAFILAMGRYQRLRGVRFPTFTEVLAVALSLGYRRVEAAGPLPTYRSTRAGNPGRGHD